MFNKKKIAKLERQIEDLTNKVKDISGLQLDNTTEIKNLYTENYIIQQKLKELQETVNKRGMQ